MKAFSLILFFCFAATVLSFGQTTSYPDQRNVVYVLKHDAKEIVIDQSKPGESLDKQDPQYIDAISVIKDPLEIKKYSEEPKEGLVYIELKSLEGSTKEIKARFAAAK